jgi:hypothetical protein
MSVVFADPVFPTKLALVEVTFGSFKPSSRGAFLVEKLEFG